MLRKKVLVLSVDTIAQIASSFRFEIVKDKETVRGWRDLWLIVDNIFQERFISQSQYVAGLKSTSLLFLLLLWWLENHLYGRIKNGFDILFYHNTNPVKYEATPCFPELIWMDKNKITYLLCFWTTFNIKWSPNQLSQFLPLQKFFFFFLKEKKRK